ncbi:DUF692 domain-containing protein [Sorangium sp. So ce204]|uniref:DUF692 domain-containing protein n=1 Tax=Sorangium sp. So ce204 TaxID=3133288 RepID=UPI003F639476
MTLREIPTLGIGIGYRNELRSFFDAHAREIDWYELVADRYFSSFPESADWIHSFRDEHRLVPHGLDLSLGTDEPLDPRYSREAAELIRLVRAPYYSDHLCMTQAGGIQLGHLTPLPFTRAVARRVADKAKAIQQILGVPLLLENIAYSFVLPGEMSEVAFVSEVVERADCGVLLDLTNLYINATNHGYDPYDYLRRLPLERVVQVHLAGGERHGGRWVDTHSQPVDVHPEVWALLERVVSCGALKGVLLERDQNFPSDPEEIVKDLRHAREIFSRASDTGAAAGRGAAPARHTPEIGRSLDQGDLLVGSPGAADRIAFQVAFARLLVEPQLRARFLAHPHDVARELGLPEDAVEALCHPGPDGLGAFAHQLESKRFRLISRLSPALCRLLERLGAIAHVQREFSRRRPPVESPEHASRTIRDAYWVQEVALELVQEGGIESELVEDVTRFEQALLELTTNPDAVASARSCDSLRASAQELSTAGLLDGYPAAGRHAFVRRFASQIIWVIRAIMEDQPLDAPPRHPTSVLFVKQVGLRNVLYFEINALTEQLIALCDGERTTREIIARLGERFRSLAGPPGADKTVDMLRLLIARNALVVRPSLEM